jgi:hypothetical protein
VRVFHIRLGSLHATSAGVAGKAWVRRNLGTLETLGFGNRVDLASIFVIVQVNNSIYTTVNSLFKKISSGESSLAVVI